MSDSRRIRFVAFAMAAFCGMLLPLILQALATAGGGPSTLEQKIVVGMYLVALVCAPGLFVFSQRGGSALMPRLALMPVGWLAYQVLHLLADAASQKAAPMREVAGTTMTLQLYLTLSFCLLVCGEVMLVLFRQDGTPHRLAASTPLPSAVTARLYGGLLVLSFASILMSSDEQTSTLMALAGLQTTLWTLKASLFLMFGGGLALLLVPTSPLAAAGCRLVSIVQAMLAMWLAYTIYSMVSQFVGAMAGQGGGSALGVVWKQLSALLAFASVPVIFTWALGDEVVPDEPAPQV